MPNSPTNSSSSGKLIAKDIIYAAYSFLGIWDNTSDITPFEEQLGLTTLKDLLDQWDNQDLSVYSTTPYTFPFQNGIQTYQVGATNQFICNILGNVMTVVSGTPGSVADDSVLIAAGVYPNTIITGNLGNNQYSISWTAPQPITQVSAGLCTSVPPTTNTFSNLDYNWNIPRPTKIERISIQYPAGTSQPVELEIPLVTLEYWLGIPQKNTTSLWPILCYDDAADTYRNLRFWPIPTGTANCILYAWNQLDRIDSIDDTVFAPPGYAMALKLSLTETLALHFRRTLAPEFHMKALAARTAIDNINSDIPTMRYDSIWGSSRGSNMTWESRGRVRI